MYVPKMKNFSTNKELGLERRNFLIMNSQALCLLPDAPISCLSPPPASASEDNPRQTLAKIP